ncbi:MATE family efflux transporter [Oceanivirga salmonicida]|uniref:MATE family efflux transporter n=1 Tax=Oceanivirga salmonicida TaxID=1769291 RepID=UPI0009E70104|nr:MATE family efflux transporter [Oceanivirga salmonicida]
MIKLNMKERRELILNGNTFKTLLFLSIPIIVMALVGAMIPFTDGLFLNNIIGAKRVAAITYVKPAIDIMLGLSAGLGVAAMAMIGQIVGRGDVEEVKNVSLQILVFSIFCGIFTIPISILVALYMSSTVDISMSNDVFIYVSLYSVVLPFQFLAAIFNALKNATGNPESPFYRMVVLLLLKIFFNYIFLSTLKMDIKGAVIASFFAYFLTGIWMYYDLFIKDYLYKLDIRKYYINIKIIKELVRVGFPSMLNYMMVSLGFLMINMEMKKYGSTLLGGIGIAGYINGISFQVPASIGVAVTTMISLNIGVGNKKKAKESFLIGMLFCLSISVITLLLILPFLDFYTKLFSKKELDILFIAKESLAIFTYAIIPFGIFTICQSALNGLGRTTIPLIMGFMRIWLFRYIFIILTENSLSYYSFFYGNLFSNVLAALIFIVIVFRIKWESGINYGKK